MFVLGSQKGIRLKLARERSVHIKVIAQSNVAS